MRAEARTPFSSPVGESDKSTVSSRQVAGDKRTVKRHCLIRWIKSGSLSGGQRQALALIIACMTDIQLLILDEHTAALDPKSSERVMELTDKIVREKNLTALMVTHNLRFATEYGSRLIMLHEGKSVMDLSGSEKQQVGTDNILAQFNRISIECGN